MHPPVDPREQPPRGQPPQELPPAQDPFAPAQPLPVDPYQTPYLDPYQTPYGYPPGEYSVQPQYQHPGYPPGGGGRDNVFGILALTFGIVSLPMLCCTGPAPIFGVPAVVLGIIGARRARRGTANNRSVAIWGAVCGAVSTTLAIVFWTLIVVGEWETFGYLF